MLHNTWDDEKAVFQSVQRTQMTVKKTESKITCFLYE